MNIGEDLNGPSITELLMDLLAVYDEEIVGINNMIRAHNTQVGQSLQNGEMTLEEAEQAAKDRAPQH